MVDGIRVVLADDHPLIRAGVGATLDGEDDIIMVGEATCAEEARRLCLDERPDVLLLDINMPGPPAWETVAYLGEHCPETKVLVLTAYDDDAYVRGLVAAGVAGYVLKDEVPEAIVRAVHVVVQGDKWYSDVVVRRLALQQSGSTEQERPTLSARETQIAGLLVAGLTDRQIGQELHLAERTVRASLRSIYDKLAVNTRVEAAVRVTQLGLAPTETE